MSVLAGVRKTFGGVFWRVFAAFWLANIVTLMGVTGMLLHHQESTRVQQEFKHRASGVLKDILETHGGHISQKKLRRQLRPLLFKTFHKTHSIDIVHQDRLVFSMRSHPRAPTPDFVFDIVLDSGDVYTIKTLKPRLPKMLVDTVFRVHRIHLLLMLFVSTCISLLLSWSITRPLKQLGEVSRQFAGGLTPNVPQKLLARRDEIGQLAQDFGYMMSTVSQVLTGQRQLLHDVSHELRAPLARLQVAAELLKQKQVNPKQGLHDDYVLRIHNECERIDHLIERILSFSRIEQTSEFKVFDLAKPLRDLYDNAVFENAQRKIEMDLGPEILNIFGSEELVLIALENIVRNADKYSDSHLPVHITLSREESNAVVQVRDFGSGVEEKDLEKLTEPFYRAGNKMHGDGFGLGLSIVLRIMESHGGALTIRNHKEGGLVVKLCFPLASYDVQASDV